jgi:hypothetical protein
MHSALDEVVPLTRVGGQVGLVHVIAKRARTCYPPSFPPIARQFGGKLAKLTNALQSQIRALRMQASPPQTPGVFLIQLCSLVMSVAMMSTSVDVIIPGPAIGSRPGD